ncbi:hypothetical protein [Microbacterium sp. cf332]|uniref:hypothetical protein n=1 Tax=Microbacterium sp. cf332 TaxID=1761804 RepID=UPI00115FA511|nr:hypothetical protein [Microbacterium sp. cf332]
MFIASSLLTRELGRSEGFWLADVLGAAHRDVVEAERPEWGTERAMSTPGFEEADAAVDRAEDIVDPIFERGKTVAVHLDLPDSSRLDKVTAAAVADRVLALVRWNR